MRKYYAILAAVILFIAASPLSSIAAYPSPTVKIDGVLRHFDPQCQIVNDRTMVPIRFVIEDPALDGEVSWDGDLRQVSIKARGKNIDFLIGQQDAKVDGQTIHMDTAPYIYQDRTFIPLRFLTENLGAKVEWKDQKREVNIYFEENVDKQTDMKVFAYYYYRSFAELEQNADVISDLACRWFETNGQGELFYEYQDNFEQIMAFAQEEGIKTHASIVLMDKDMLHELLSIKENRLRLIGNIVDEVKSDGYDGVDIDFEFIYPSDADNYSQFLRELKLYLGNEYNLSAAVFARTERDKWATGYDYQAIGQTVDQLVIMAYDYHYRTSAPGPVAPLWWVEDVLEYMQSIIPKEKLLLGMPTYGYDWAKGMNGITVTANKLQTIKKKYTVEEHFDQASMSPYYTYWDNYGVFHELWLENEKSLQVKLQAAIDNDIAGISFWRVGNGFDDLYHVLRDN